MRALLPALLVLALLAPSAAAGSFTLLAERHLDQDAGSAGVTVFAMPVRINQGGVVYAKLLATEGNAVNDGYRANGSVEARTGWRVAFAWLYANGTRVELGSFVDGVPTALVPVVPDEQDQLLVTVRWPNDAQTVGGATQTAWAALAYRAQADAAGPGATSGVSMDEARAMSFTLHFAEGVATAPAGQNVPPPPAPSTPTPATGGTSGSGAGSTPPPPSASGEASSPTPAVPSVGPLETSSPATPAVVVVQPVLPAWFLAGALVLAGLAVVALAALAFGVFRLTRALAPARGPVRVPVAHEESAEPPAPLVGREQERA